MRAFVFILSLVVAYYWGFVPAYVVWIIGEYLTAYIDACQNANTESQSSTSHQSYSNEERRNNGSNGYRQSSPKETMEHWYSVLGVSYDATDAEVKKAYRKMAMECHPDHMDNTNEELCEQANKRFCEVNEAYEAVKQLRHMK